MARILKYATLIFLGTLLVVLTESSRKAPLVRPPTYGSSLKGCPIHDVRLEITGWYSNVPYDGCIAIKECAMCNRIAAQRVAYDSLIVYPLIILYTSMSLAWLWV